MKKMNQFITSLLAGNTNDGTNMKIYEKVKGETYQIIEDLGIYNSKESIEKGLKMKNSKGPGYSYWGQHQKKNKQGYGIRVQTDGSIYEGKWENDHPFGKGRQIAADGSYYEGVFENDYNMKTGKLVTKHKEILEGQFKGIIPEGSCR